MGARISATSITAYQSLWLYANDFVGTGCMTTSVKKWKVNDAERVTIVCIRREEQLDVSDPRNSVAV